MRTLVLARKVLALSVCLAIPFPALAGDMSRATLGGARPIIAAAAASQFHQELHLGVESLIPAGVSVENAVTSASLYSLIEVKPQAEAASQARAQANAFLARIMLLPQEQARVELSAAHVPEATAERILAAADGAQARKASDPALKKAFKMIETGKAPSPSIMRKARNLAATLENAFKRAAPEQALVMAGIDHFDTQRTIRASFGAASELIDGQPLRADAGSLVRGFIPVAKKVSELRKLSAENPEAAFALAEKILSDNAEPRVEVRAAALRALEAASAERRLPIFVKAAENPANWYIQRLAIQYVGKSAPALAGKSAISDPAVAALKQAYKSSNPSVRLMAKWSLEQFGVDAGPEPAPSLADSLRGRVPIPAPRMGFISNSNQGGSQNGGPKKGPSLLKIALIGLMALLMFRIFTASPAPKTEVKAPTQVEQTIQIPAPKLPEAKNPEQQVMNQMATDVHEMAVTAKRAQAQSERLEAERKAKEEAKSSGGGGMMLGILFQLAMAILPIFLLVWLFKKMQGGAAGSVAKNLSGGKMNLEKPDTRFTDVAGVDDALLQVQQVADAIRNPQRYTRLGAKLPKGILLEGPPGTGKTLMARALAGESDANFISMKGSDFIELFVGVGAGRVRELFETARRAAPTILFIDEIDAIGRARGKENISGGSSEHDQTLIALIAELDGFSKMDNVIVVAATNRSDVLDPALMRPGRFDRKIYVGTPDVLGREAILAVHGSKYRLGPDVDLEFTARRTSGLAGAGMANILNEAATQGAMDDHAAVTSEDVQRGVDKETMGERRHLFLGDGVKKRVAVHESGHALAMMLANPQAKAPNKITIIPHGPAALGYAEQAEEGEGDSYLLTQDQLEDRIVGAMGGRAAEELIYGKDDPRKGISTGPGSDIEDHADRLARVMVTKLGMSEKVGIIDAGPDKRSPMGAYKVGEKTRDMVDDEVRRITRDALAKAKRLLRENLDKLDGMVDILTQRETIYQSEIDAIVRPPMPPSTQAGEGPGLPR